MTLGGCPLDKHWDSERGGFGPFLCVIQQDWERGPQRGAFKPLSLCKHPMLVELVPQAVSGRSSLARKLRHSRGSGELLPPRWPRDGGDSAVLVLRARGPVRSQSAEGELPSSPHLPWSGLEGSGRESHLEALRIRELTVRPKGEVLPFWLRRPSFDCPL